MKPWKSKIWKIKINWFKQRLNPTSLVWPIIFSLTLCACTKQVNNVLVFAYVDQNLQFWHQIPVLVFCCTLCWESSKSLLRKGFEGNTATYTVISHRTYTIKSVLNPSVKLRFRSQAVTRSDASTLGWNANPSLWLKIRLRFQRAKEISICVSLLSWNKKKIVHTILSKNDLNPTYQITARNFIQFFRRKVARSREKMIIKINDYRCTFQTFHRNCRDPFVIVIWPTCGSKPWPPATRLSLRAAAGIKRNNASRLRKEYLAERSWAQRPHCK